MAGIILSSAPSVVRTCQNRPSQNVSRFFLAVTLPYVRRWIEISRQPSGPTAEGVNIMDVQGILKQLEMNAGTFPREAVAQAIEPREAITPELLRILTTPIEILSI